MVTIVKRVTHIIEKAMKEHAAIESESLPGYNDPYGRKVKTWSMEQALRDRRFQSYLEIKISDYLLTCVYVYAERLEDALVHTIESMGDEICEGVHNYPAAKELRDENFDRVCKCAIESAEQDARFIRRFCEYVRKSRMIP